MPVTYRDAGVDIDAGEELVERIKPLAKSTRIPEVVSDVGGFAGLCSLPLGIEDPLLVSGTDGVGTKLKLAFALDKHDTIGIDLVAMNVNDVVTTGARPLFFLDYFGCGKLEVGTAEQVIRGIAEGCRQAGCALLGGETAELPDMYPVGEYDLAGFAVGVVARKKVLGAQRVRTDDVLIGVASSGLHSNGYSLARKVLLSGGLELDSHVPELGTTLGEALITPTRIYAKAVQSLLGALGDDLHALCHITGGGIPGNLPRVLPANCVAHIEEPALPTLFALIEKRGPVERKEMRRTFNCGIGLVVVAQRGSEQAAIQALTAAGETAFVLGRLEPEAGLETARVAYRGD
ncbi:MAG: phosphoribosylformylglycinamidine cyclo-ligase [Myxococcota bacterium]